MRGAVRKDERDVSVELLRCVATLYVISIHLNPPRFISNQIQYGALLGAILFGDANAFFFALTGFFWFRKEVSFRAIIASFLKKVLVPAVLSLELIYIFVPFLHSPSLYPSFDQLQPPSLKILHTFLFLHLPGSIDTSFGQYHYVIRYMKTVLVYPLLNAIAAPENRKGLRWILVGKVVSAIIFDMKVCKLQNWINPVDIIQSESAFVLLGHYLYSGRSTKSSRTQPVILLVGAAATLLACRFYCQQIIFRKSTTNNIRFLMWDCFFSYLNCTMYVITALRLQRVSFPARVSGLIRWFGKRSFFILLAHMAVLVHLRAIGVVEFIKQKTLTGGLCSTAIYYASETLVVVLCTIPVAVLLQRIHTTISTLSSWICNRQRIEWIFPHIISF